MVIIQLDSEQLSSLIQTAVRKVLHDQPPTEYRPASDEETPLTIVEASDFLGVSKQTVYQNIARIPHKKRFGRLYFFRSQLAEYLNAGEGVTI